MAHSRPVAAALVLAVTAGAVVYAGIAFVSAPAQGSGRRLRASSVLASQGPAGPAAPAGGAGLLAATSLGSLLVAAGLAAARRGAVARRAEESSAVAQMPVIPRPEDLDPNDPRLPQFVGSVNGYMSKSTRERHAITWTAKEEAFFEVNGGTAQMNKGENLCYFRKKEQALALGKALRQMKIDNYKIYRIKKDGTVIFMHPSDGVFPEKVNAGRVQVNGRPFTVCQNPLPSAVEWTKYHMRVYEADPLTTMFVKAKIDALMDVENLFPMPNFNSYDLIDQTQEVKWAEDAPTATAETPGTGKSL